MAIIPLEDRIVVRINEAETTTASGLLIPDVAQQKPQEGTVIAVGQGRFENGVRIPLDIQVGDVVIFSKYGGTEIQVDGESLMILTSKDVLAITE